MPGPLPQLTYGRVIERVQYGDPADETFITRIRVQTPTGEQDYESLDPIVNENGLVWGGLIGDESTGYTWHPFGCIRGCGDPEP